MNNDFLLSVIIPVYNAGKYLGDSIESVINQSISFQHIQLVLVNDGSTDTSAEVCKKYLKKYPSNVVYVEQANAGVSAARNRGLAHASGKYVHFFDSDDILSPDSYLEMINFLEGHTEAIDFVAIKIKFFDEIIDAHPLNYKFTSNRIIDVTEEPDAPIMHVSSCLFKAEVAHTHTFDEQLRITEDTKYVSEILNTKKAYGTLAKPTLHYRRRSDGSSVIDGKYLQKDFYQETIDLAYDAIANGWKNSDGVIGLYAQYTLLYDIGHRLNQESQTVLTEGEVADYKSKIKNLVSQFDDAVIINNRHLDTSKKVYLLKWKYGDDFSNYLTQNGDIAEFNGHPLVDYSTQTIHLDFIHENVDNTLSFEGYLPQNPLASSDVYNFKCGSEIAMLEFVARQQRTKTFLGEIVSTGGAFVATLRASRARGRLQLVINGSETRALVETGQFTNIGNVGGSYATRLDLLIRKVGQTLTLQRSTLLRRIAYNIAYSVGLATFWNLPKAREQYGKLKGRNVTMLSKKAKLFELAKPFLFMAETITFMPRALYLRTLYHLYKIRKRKPIWLISDRAMAAGDNGEALFRYINQQTDCKADVYFAIAKDSKDFKRLQKIGKVVDQASLRYKLLFLLSDLVISSHADIETTNPFIRQLDQYVDLFTFDFVFLQHGVTKDDVSSWLNRFEKNIRLFVTSGHSEYQSILDGPYYYSTKEVILTGMPRFDLLENEPAGKLILAPTYRKQLALEKTDKSGRRAYDASFKKSRYFEFYNNLMNDTRITEVLAKANMVGEFYIHPNLEAQRRDFVQNEWFKTMEFPYDYKRAFKEGNLLISDHSSVVFDFAYLKKPVVYAHFDIEALFAGHSYTQGTFFSDERNGFGPIYTEYETLVEGVVDLLKGGCAMSEQYKQRVDDFFFAVDHKNSERVYGAIQKL